MPNIHVSDQGLQELKESLARAGEDYKTKLKKLQNVMSQITSGDIKGDLADDLKAKFDAKEEIFTALAQTIDDAEEYAGVKGTKFVNMIGDTKAVMK